MKYDKETIAAIVLCLVFLLGWQHIVRLIYPSADSPEPTAYEQIEGEDVSKPLPPSITPGDEPIGPGVGEDSPEHVIDFTPPPAVARAAGVEVLPPIKLRGDLTEVEIDPNGGFVRGVSLLKYLRGDKSTEIVLGANFEPGPLAVSEARSWTATGTPEALVGDGMLTLTRGLERADHSHFIMRQEWELGGEYQIKYRFAISNPGVEDIAFSGLSVNVGNLPPLVMLGGDNVRRDPHYVDLRLAVNGGLVGIAAESKPGEWQKYRGAPALWLGVSNKYFASILLPSNGALFDGGGEKFRFQAPHSAADGSAAGESTVLGVVGVIGDVVVPAGGFVEWEFTYYAGPKEIHLLDQLAPDATKVMRLGWAWLEWISQLLLRFLIFLNGFCGSYGWSIVVMTIIVRCAFWPITQKANTSMRKMQKLQPKIKALREKHKDNPQEMNRQVMLLYSENKVNPLGGCLPIILQIPVFLALYQTLDGSIELRHTAFLWAEDLSRPDTIGHLFGLAINPLVLAMSATMLLQQHLTPMGGDPNQKKIMMFMPVMMLFFLYNLPSGLTLYWTVSQVISIIQLKINQKLNSREDAEPNTVKAKA